MNTTEEKNLWDKLADLEKRLDNKEEPEKPTYYIITVVLIIAIMAIIGFS